MFCKLKQPTVKNKVSQNFMETIFESQDPKSAKARLEPYTLTIQVTART